MERVEKIKNILVQDFEPTKLEIFDESHLHAGHEGAKSGKGHFRVAIQSMKFVGQSETEPLKICSKPTFMHLALQLKLQSKKTTFT